MNPAIGIEVLRASGPFGMSLNKRQFAQLPSCATGCVADEMGRSCMLDPTCLCGEDFLKSIACCVTDACDADDRDGTVEYASSFCRSLNLDAPAGDMVCGSPSATARETTTTTTSAPSTTTTTTSPSQSSTQTSTSPGDSSTDDPVNVPPASDAGDGNTSSGSGGLSRNATIGLGVGIAVGVILLILAAWILLRRRRRKQQQPPVEGSAAVAPYAHSPGAPYEMGSKGFETKITPLASPFPSEIPQPPQIHGHGYEMAGTPKLMTNTTVAVPIRNDDPHLPEMMAGFIPGRGPELPATPLHYNAVMAGHTGHAVHTVDPGTESHPRELPEGSVPGPELPASPPPQHLYPAGQAPDSRTDPYLPEMPDGVVPGRELPASPVPGVVYPASRTGDPRLDPHVPELQGSPGTYRQQDPGAEQESAMLRRRQTQIAEERERLLRLARLEEEESEIRRRLDELER